MSEDFLALHEQIRSARADLVTDLTALVAKTDVKANLRHRAAGIGHRMMLPLRRVGAPAGAIAGATSLILVLVWWGAARRRRT